VQIFIIYDWRITSRVAKKMYLIED